MRDEADPQTGTPLGTLLGILRGSPRGSLEYPLGYLGGSPQGTPKEAHQGTIRGYPPDPSRVSCEVPWGVQLSEFHDLGILGTKPTAHCHTASYVLPQRHPPKACPEYV